MKQNIDPTGVGYPFITIGYLRQQLKGAPDDWTIDFSGLDFHRIQSRGDTHLQMEFNQPVYRTPEGRVVVGNLD